MSNASRDPERSEIKMVPLNLVCDVVSRNTVVSKCNSCMDCFNVSSCPATIYGFVCGDKYYWEKLFKKMIENGGNNNV